MWLIDCNLPNIGIIDNPKAQRDGVVYLSSQNLGSFKISFVGLDDQTELLRAVCVGKG